jgi:hypothetical protein
VWLVTLRALRPEISTAMRGLDVRNIEVGKRMIGGSVVLCMNE